ncbi:MAG: hypothetical protein WC455_12205 [Dehalococcoidia bacterium]|jgi:hypothetical protein
MTMKKIKIKDGQVLPWIEAVRANYGPISIDDFRALQSGAGTSVDTKTAEALIAAGFCDDFKGEKDGNNVE